MTNYIGTRWVHVNTWQKSGIIYVIHDICKIEKTNTNSFLYSSELDFSSKWVRPIEEFLDGRYVQLQKDYMV